MAERLQLRMAQAPYLAQIELNKLEAQSRSWFNSGWRPAVGWVLAISLALYYIPQFAMAAVLWSLVCIETGTLVAYPVEIHGLKELLLSMLGLGAIRTYEKVKGKAA